MPCSTIATKICAPGTIRSDGARQAKLPLQTYAGKLADNERMITAHEIRIEARGVRSLVWYGDELIDWAAGGTRFLLNGETVSRQVLHAYEFDAAVMSQSGEFAVVYTRLGTKGLVLQRGKIIREINRSHYHASAYEYPVAIARLKDGREVLIHCPEEYCRLEIEELASGKRLTGHSSRQPQDFFHSRLAVSPDGQMLSSAGWIWHPIDAVRAFDIEAALQDPSQLDIDGFGMDALAAESSAAFTTDGRLILALNEAISEEEEDPGASSSATFEIRTFDFRISRAPTIVRHAERLGTFMPVGAAHLLGLFECPRLVDAATGAELKRWPHLHSGEQTSSILLSRAPLPAIALDPARRRCAIADSEGITVLVFDD